MLHQTIFLLFREMVNSIMLHRSSPFPLFKMSVLYPATNNPFIFQHCRTLVLLTHISAYVLSTVYYFSSPALSVPFYLHVLILPLWILSLWIFLIPKCIYLNKCLKPSNCQMRQQNTLAHRTVGWFFFSFGSNGF